VTLLLTDVEDSVSLWEQSIELMVAALERSSALFDAAVVRHRGIYLRTSGAGDMRVAVFDEASEAVAAALLIQRMHAVEAWPTARPIMLRLGVCTGEVEVRDGDVYGRTVNRCARLCALDHGGQVLLCEATMTLVCDDLPSGSRLIDLGKQQLRGLLQPERVFQVVASDLPIVSPPPA
jgi:class 3 adenylate cyclase